jgi:NDP-sugar pyrophosphorylase family protein
MPLGEQSILEILVDQLKSYGIRDLTLCVGYLSHLIRAVFDTHATRGINIRYVREETPLGTAGPLRLVDDPGQTFLVMNGDVLTTLDFRELVRHHRRSGNILTIASSRRTITMDYGILHVDGDQSNRLVVGYEEKPEVAFVVSMGIYVLEPEAIDHIPEGYFDFPDLIGELLAAGEPVGAYLHDGIWFDIGRHEDYARAVAAWEGDGRPSGAETFSLRMHEPQA